MNAAAKNINPPEPKTPEDVLKTFEPADSRHSVHVQFGNAVGTFYNVPEGFYIDESIHIGGWLAMPLHDCNGKIIGIAYLSPDRSIKPIFDPQYLNGCVIFGNPEKDKPLFVVSCIVAAFALSLAGYVVLLTFTPIEPSTKNSPQPKDAGNMAYVVKEWSWVMMSVLMTLQAQSVMQPKN